MFLLFLVAVPTVASAGGPIAKATGKVTFVNNSAVDAYVILDQKSPPAITDFQRLGGLVIPPAGRVTFAGLKQGAHTWGAKFSATTPTNTTPDKTGSFSATNGKTTTIPLAQ